MISSKTAAESAGFAMASASGSTRSATEFHLTYPFHASRWRAVVLHDDGWLVNRKRVGDWSSRRVLSLRGRSPWRVSVSIRAELIVTKLPDCVVAGRVDQ